MNQKDVAMISFVGRIALARVKKVYPEFVSALAPRGIAQRIRYTSNALKRRVGKISYWSLDGSQFDSY
jgi:hypothetical protein